MKKSMTLGILFLSAMFLASCSKSPKDKLVGEWQMTIEGTTITLMTFKSDGTGKIFEESGTLGAMTWKVTEEDKESLTVEFYEDSVLEDTTIMKFTSDDDLSVLSQDGTKLALTRKK